MCQMSVRPVSSVGSIILSLSSVRLQSPTAGVPQAPLSALCGPGTDATAGVLSLKHRGLQRASWWSLCSKKLTSAAGEGFVPLTFLQNVS